jgi:glyoxylate reductase
VESQLGAAATELEDLLRRSDVISLHAPANPETRHLIDAGAIELMGDRAILVNTSRGSLVDLEAVADALRDGRLGAVGLDVYEGEPDVPKVILDAPRTVLTPHIGSATIKARDAMAVTVATNVLAVLDGEEPPNRVV